MSNYAIVENNLVINTCVWDGTSDWTPPKGTTAIQIPIDSVAGVGYSYIDGQFIAPVIKPVIDELQDSQNQIEELLARIKLLESK